MKKKYIDGSSVDPNWLIEHTSKTHHVKGKYNGVVSFIHVIKVASKITVDYDDSDTCLIDNGYKCLVFLPKNKNFCVSTFFTPEHEIVEWYFDMTKENMTSINRPYFMDLYLDIAVSAKHKIRILDEDELLQAHDDGIITSEDVQLAKRTCDEVIKHYISDKNFMVDFFYDQLKVLDE